MFSQLLHPLLYVFIRHPEKWKIDWLIPIILTVPTMLLFFFLEPKVNIYGDKGFIQAVTAFVQTMPGFYVAALAAVVTFSRESMDDIIPEPTPRIVERLRGRRNEIRLTRRRFLSMMFAFLTAESFAVVILGIAGTLLAPTFKVILSPQATILASFAVLLVYIFVVMQMIVTTCWGLYYLGTRIHKGTN
jgi:hypothetical protein